MSQLGPIEIPFKTWDSVEDNAFFCPDPDKVPELEAYMDQLRRDQDSGGAKITVVAEGVMPGLGEPIFDRLDAEIAHAMMSINAVKGVDVWKRVRWRCCCCTCSCFTGSSSNASGSNSR